MLYNNISKKNRISDMYDEVRNKIIENQKLKSVKINKDLNTFKKSFRKMIGGC